MMRNQYSLKIRQVVGIIKFHGMSPDLLNQLVKGKFIFNFSLIMPEKILFSRNSFSTSFSLPMQSTIEPDRPTTAPLVLEETTRRPTSGRMKSNRPFNPPVVDLSNNFDRPTDLSVIPTNSKPLEKKNPPVQRSYTDSHIRDSIPDSIVVHTLPSEIKEEIVDQSKIPRRNSQCKVQIKHEQSFIFIYIRF